MVVVMCVPGCGASTCVECSRGSPQICPKGPHFGGGHDGFFATYAVVPERAAAILPSGVSVEAGAVATDACMTAHHAVVDRAKVTKGDVVLILGLGGLGFNALQIALSRGARLVVADQRQIVLDEAEKLGVKREDIVPAGTPDPSDWIRKRNLDIDKVIDFVGMTETFKLALASGKDPILCFFSFPLVAYRLLTHGCGNSSQGWDHCSRWSTRPRALICDRDHRASSTQHRGQLRRQHSQYQRLLGSHPKRSASSSSNEGQYEGLPGPVR